MHTGDLQPKHVHQASAHAWTRQKLELVGCVQHLKEKSVLLPRLSLCGQYWQRRH